MQQRESRARVRTAKLHDRRELELIINLITAIYRTVAKQVKPLVLKLQTNEKRTTITFQHLLFPCKFIYYYGVIN